LQLNTCSDVPFTILEQDTDPIGDSSSTVHGIHADISGLASVPEGQEVAVKRQAGDPLVDSRPSGQGRHTGDEGTAYDPSGHIVHLVDPLVGVMEPSEQGKQVAIDVALS